MRGKRGQRPGPPVGGRERRITRGGLKLRELLKRRKLKVTDFAKSAGVNRLSVLRVTNGERWEFISVDFALAIRDATRGAIEVEDFASITSVPLADEEEEEPERRRRTGTDG